MSNLLVIVVVAVVIPALLVLAVQLREWLHTHHHWPPGKSGGYQH